MGQQKHGEKTNFLLNVDSVWHSRKSSRTINKKRMQLMQRARGFAPRGSTSVHYLYATRKRRPTRARILFSILWKLFCSFHFCLRTICISQCTVSAGRMHMHMLVSFESVRPITSPAESLFNRVVVRYWAMLSLIASDLLLVHGQPRSGNLVDRGWCEARETPKPTTSFCDHCASTGDRWKRLHGLELLPMKRDNVQIWREHRRVFQAADRSVVPGPADCPTVVATLLHSWSLSPPAFSRPFRKNFVLSDSVSSSSDMTNLYDARPRPGPGADTCCWCRRAGHGTQHARVYTARKLL